MIDAAQLGKIAARIESSHDAEALTAARMLVKRLGGHNLRLADVVERGIAGGKPGNFDWTVVFRSQPSPPPATHRVKIDAMLRDPRFMGEYLTRRSVDRLRSLYRADFLDPINMQWIDGLMEKAREMREGRERP
ncbi:hypothetical protein BV96_01774 [Sphingomonas paucimobilis]|nr:hypothetical protein BV96_01774 [Sphingomonas paucimobilis]